MPDYVIKDLVPGYKGKFVIHSHKATHFHFDLRLEFPVTSVKESLKEYSTKRKFDKTPEPAGSSSEKTGHVLRSWAIPKHKVPTSKPILAQETEDHEFSYGSFRGTIPEGEYGAGTVDIFDKGTFKLLDVEYDRKYVFTMQGKKISGIYSLIKLRGKSFLWGKVKNKEKYLKAVVIKNASAIDYVRRTLPPEIWDLNNLTLKPNVKDLLLKYLKGSLTKAGFTNPMNWIQHIYISGSCTGFNYKPDGDFDIDIECNMLKFRQQYPKFNNFNDKEIKDRIQKILDMNRSKTVPGSKRTFSFFFVDLGDFPGSDGVYDVIQDRWVKSMCPIPLSFDPDAAFKKQKAIALAIMNISNKLIMNIKVLVKDLYRIDQYRDVDSDRSAAKKQDALIKLERLCQALAAWRQFIWGIHDRAKDKQTAIYPAFDYSTDWSENYIIFKYIARYSGHEPVEDLLEQLKDNDYISIIKNFLPEGSVSRFFKEE